MHTSMEGLTNTGRDLILAFGRQKKINIPCFDKILFFTFSQSTVSYKKNSRGDNPLIARDKRIAPRADRTRVIIYYRT
jgi:hypothetical protein